MKKVLLAAALCVAVSLSGFAQSKSHNDGKFSIGIEGGIPVGDASNTYNAVIGGSLKYEMPIATSTAFTISAGYNSFLGKTIAGFKNPAAGYIPVKAGIKYNFGQGLYGEAQIGAAFGTQSGSGTAFAYSPGIGYDFGGGVDIGVRYEGWSRSGGTMSQIGLRLGFSF